MDRISRGGNLKIAQWQLRFTPAADWRAFFCFRRFVLVKMGNFERERSARGRPKAQRGGAEHMTRREAREQAFCLLFEQAAGGEDIDSILHAAAEARDLVPDPFAEELAWGAEAQMEKIDQVISENIRGWSLRRLSKVALALLRLSVYELLFQPGIPASVSINEAVELAKTYGGKDDAPYINGVLASVARRHRAEE